MGLVCDAGYGSVREVSVLERQREIGFRMAIGAEAVGVVRLVTVDAFLMVLVGATAGSTFGLALARYGRRWFTKLNPPTRPCRLFHR